MRRQIAMKIKDLEIENFKVFGNKFDKVKDVSDMSLVLLNGPNGYGKTTLFDAIELALTGKIKRIGTYTEDLAIKQNETHQKLILISDEMKEAYVKLTLESEETIIELNRIYRPSKSKVRKASKAKNPNTIFEKFTLKIKVNGQEIEEEKVNGVLEQYHLNDIRDFYDKCCFLSQDEHLGFLKEAGKNKASALEFLFEVPEEQKAEETRVIKIMKRLRNKNRTSNLGCIQILETQKETLDDEIEKLEKRINDSGENSKSVEYKKIFTEQPISWDQEIKNLNGKEYDEAMEELDKLVYFSEHQEECLTYIFNNPYRDILKPFAGGDKITYKKNALEYAYRYYPLIKQEKVIERKYEKQQKYNTLKDVLDKKELKLINWTFITEENLIEEDLIERIKEKLIQVADLEKTQGIVSSVISKMKKTRITLINQRKNAIEEAEFNDKICPFCGTSFEEKESLEKAIKEESNTLQALCDDSGKKIEDLISELYETYFTPLLEKVNENLKDPISEEVYLKLQKVKKDRNNILNTKDLLDKINIRLPEKSENYQEDIAQLNREYEELKKQIEDKLNTVSEEVVSQLDAFDFMHKFEQYYKNSKDAFKMVTEELLNLKKEYIQQCFYNLNVKAFHEKKNQLKKISGRLEQANEYYNKLENYLTAIQDGMKAYKKKIIHDIEPLLYVYTAKILQQKFNGKSIFIQADEDMKNIGFINSVEDNQNILYSMSSGQLAAVALSFLLCMNQVYTKNRLPILLIDDPIQTIDDVNMVGLVDILRYEFGESQIFISTHEQKFEWYLRYKYEKTGKKFKLYNMKQLLLEENS